MNMLEQAQKIAPELIRLRRDIHMHPELGFEETRTAALVSDTLRELGIEVEEGVGKTGVIGRIGSGDGPTIGIRADMDALPIEEANDVPYKSKTPGLMHACGHDAHTATLLGVAHLLKQSYAEEKWKGNVRFLFQPSEEMSVDDVSGAPAMITDNALEGVDAVIALHVASHAPAGVFAFQDGYSLAATDEFNGWIRGSGGHGAYPYQGTDPVHMLSSVLDYLYSIPSRKIDPLMSAVCSVGQVQAGGASNVIPSEVFVSGTLRSHDPDVRIQLQKEAENAFKLAEALGGSYEFKLHSGYPSMFNSAEVNNWMRSAVTDLIGAEAVQNVAFGMGGEDFSYMTQAAKGAMFMLGAATKDGVERGHHTPIFDIDESVLPMGAAVMAETARRFVLGQLG